MPSTEVVAATRTGEGVGVGEDPERSWRGVGGPSMELTQFHSNDNLNKQSTRMQSKQQSEQETFSSCFPSLLLVVWKYLFSINYFRLSREASRRFFQRDLRKYTACCV